MSRLGKIINVAEEKAFDVSKTNIVSSFTTNKGSLDETTKISMNRICGRYKNDYIIDPAKTKVLVNSIEKEGLLQPIVLMNINDYLKSNDVQDDEVNYYKEKLSKGFDFFIVAGHRRFRAYASLLSGELIESSEELEKFYSDIKDTESEIGKKFVVSIGKKADEPWTKILAIVANPENLDEILAYLHSNITSRVPSQFEIVTSVYNQLKRSNQIEAVMEKYSKSQRDGIPVVLKRYLEDVYAIEIDKGRINRYRRLVDTADSRIIDVIYEGKISIKDIEALLPVYPTIQANNDEETLLYEILAGTFSLNKWKNKYKEEAKPKPDKTYASKDVLDLLMKIKNNEITLDEAIKNLNK